MRLHLLSDSSHFKCFKRSSIIKIFQISTFKIYHQPQTLFFPYSTPAFLGFTTYILIFLHLHACQYDPREAQTKQTWWVSNIKSFFHLPNPRILTLFIIGSTATTLLGIAMIVEWVLHGQYHPGCFWILYCAPSLIALPILVWIICIIFAIFYTNDQNLHTLPISDLSKKQSQTEVLEQVQPLQDQQAVEENGIDDYDQSQTSCLIKKPPSLRSTSRAGNDIDHKLALKRTNSVQLYHTHTDYRGIRRTFSFQQ